MTPSSPVRRPARLLAPLAVLLVLALTACGGDDGDDAGGGSGDSGGVDAGDVPALQGESCDSEVTLTGAEEAEWSGEATVDVSDSDVAPPATYQSNHDGYMLTVSAVGNGFDDPTVTLLHDGAAYAVPFGEGSVEVAADGSGAEIDAPAQDPGGDGTVQVTASFSC